MSDDTGYELDDPKHPTYYERYAGAADHTRKAEKENEEGPEPDGSRYLGNGLYGATDR